MITREIEQACMASLDCWMIALNAHDVDATKDHTVIGTYESMYVMTLKEG